MTREQMIDEAVRSVSSRMHGILSISYLGPDMERHVSECANCRETVGDIRAEFRRIAEADAYQRERDDPIGQNRDWTLLKLRQMSYR